MLDLFSRRVLGYAMGAHHDASLVVAALHMAAATRGGDLAGVIMHSGYTACATSRARSTTNTNAGQARRSHGSRSGQALSLAGWSSPAISFPQLPDGELRKPGVPSGSCEERYEKTALDLKRSRKCSVQNWVLRRGETGKANATRKPSSSASHPCDQLSLLKIVNTCSTSR